jgi:hypothetical protein
MGQDSSVSIVTRYGLDIRGSNYNGGKIFHTHPDQLWGPPSLLYKMGTGSFLGVKRPGCGIDHPPPSSAKVKERVRAIPLLLLWALVACSRVNFIFTLYKLQL